jgi:PAS domain S-box-containing protein
MQKITAEAILQCLSEICMDGIIVVDDKGEIVFFNNAYCRNMNVKPEDIKGKIITEVFKSSRLIDTMRERKTIEGYLHDISVEDTKCAEKMLYINRSPIISKEQVIGAIAIQKSISVTNDIYNALNRVHEELKYFRNEIKNISGTPQYFDDIPECNLLMSEVKKMAMRAARTNLPVLLLGETGTGKEVFANAIQNESDRKDKNFIKVNCAALPHSLLESELFGYEEGAFSGAKKGGKIGKFDLANHGTIFLDEIGELHIDLQAKLLRVLQGGEFQRIGGVKTVKVDFRLISATNMDLQNKIQNKEFRSDLYYRLSAVSLEIPPLRKRQEDILYFANLFLDEINKKNGTHIAVSEEVLERIIHLPLYGNIRELNNIIERACLFCDSGEISPDDIRFVSSASLCKADSSAALTILEQSERDSIIKILEELKYNCARTAARLGISRANLYQKVKKYNIPLKRNR